MTSHFEFIQEADNYVGRAGDYVVLIPSNLASKGELFAALRVTLRFPAYCGANWDALLDCLRDLSWLEPGRLVLVHKSVPGLQDDDLRKYLEVLRSATNDWEPGEDHELHVVFPAESRSTVMRSMRTE